MNSLALVRLGAYAATFVGGLMVGLWLRPGPLYSPKVAATTESRQPAAGKRVLEHSASPSSGTDTSAHGLASAERTSRQDFLAHVGETMLLGSSTIRQRRFLELLDRMEPGDAVAVRKYLADTMDQGILYEQEWEAFWTRWGEIDGPAAMDFILTKQEHGAVPKDIRRVMRAWGAKDAVAATDWLDEHQELFAKNKKDLGDALVGAVDGLASVDLAGATRLALQAVPAGDPSLGALMETLAEQAVRQGRADGVARWFEQLPHDATPGSARAAALGHVYWRLLKSSQDRALDWVQAQASQPWRSDRIVAELAGKVAETNPVRAVEWLQALPPASDGSYPGLKEVIVRWRRTDQAGAQQWLAQQSPSDFKSQVEAGLAVSAPQAARPSNQQRMIIQEDGGVLVIPPKSKYERRWGRKPVLHTQVSARAGGQSRVRNGRHFYRELRVTHGTSIVADATTSHASADDL